MHSFNFFSGRLPFKPLDYSSQTLGGITPSPVNKKRKLSDNESPSAKQLRISSAAPHNAKPPSADGEPEVSSSSEADVNADTILLKPGQKVNTIDKFFQRRSKNSDQEEITSTNQGVEILDLTGEASDEGKSESSESIGNKKTEEKTTVDKQQQSDNVQAIDSEVEKENNCNENSKEEDSEADEEDTEENEAEAEVSFIENTSVCEDALKTPRKDMKLESILKVHCCFFFLF